MSSAAETTPAAESGEWENRNVMKKTKVVILQKRIKEYRVPLFDGIGELYDTTVVGYQEPLLKGDHYSVLKLKHKYWPVSLDYIWDKALRNALRKADVIIRPTDFRAVNRIILKAAAPKAKVISFGIGVSASYHERYDEVDQSEQYLKIIRDSDAVVFYYDYPKEKYVKQGADPNKIFVSNNTVFVPDLPPCRQPENLLFIGELYRQKGVDVLLEQYLRAYKEDPDVPKLIIVGDGAECAALEKTVKESGLGEKVSFLGKITDDSRLKEIFDTAIVTISPKQAGLSVLKSMAFGVPFVTIQNAVTGGEIFNIENGETGVILKDENALKDLILDCADNIGFYNAMGERAREFYFSHRTMAHSVRAFDEAIRYALSR